MKTKAIIFIGTVLASCLATAASGDLGQPIRASEILGSTIKDSQDQKVGTVKDLAVDMENGRIVEIIVGWGGVLGVDEKFTAAPPANFAMGVDGKTVRFNMDRNKLEGAPAVDMSKWKDAMEQSRVVQAYQYYGQTPYFLVEEHGGSHAANPATTLHLGEVERTSKLIGTETMNHQDQQLGKVANMVVDLADGRVVEVIIKSGHFLGVRDELSAVPPQVLHFDADRDVLTLDITKEGMSSAPHFPASAWPQIDRDQATAVYQAYHVIPYFLPIGTDTSAQYVPNGNGKIQTPVEQGTSQADLQITAKIQKEILDADGLSVDAKAVKVITVNGRVTLRGMVANPAEKRRMGEIAARIVPAENVDNQLEVKENAASAAN